MLRIQGNTERVTLKQHNRLEINTRYAVYVGVDNQACSCADITKSRVGDKVISNFTQINQSKSYVQAHAQHTT